MTVPGLRPSPALTAACTAPTAVRAGAACALAAQAGFAAMEFCQAEGEGAGADLLAAIAEERARRRGSDGNTEVGRWFDAERSAGQPALVPLLDRDGENYHSGALAAAPYAATDAPVDAA